MNSGQSGDFPRTRLSVIEDAASDDPRRRAGALETLGRSYWKPIYRYIRLKWNAEPPDAEDLTQEFFAKAIDKGYFEKYDPAVARFRTFVRVCVDRFVANERRDAARQKRGGGHRHVPWDFAPAEAGLGAITEEASGDPDSIFQREWIRNIFSLALEDLRAYYERQDKMIQYRVFERYDLEGAAAGEEMTYASLAGELGLTTTRVTNYLHAVRRRFRTTVLNRVREVTASDSEFRSEARELLGGAP